MGAMNGSLVNWLGEGLCTGAERKCKKDITLPTYIAYMYIHTQTQRYIFIYIHMYVYMSIR